MERKSKFYSLYVTGGMEVRTALVIAERARNMNLDLRSIVIPPEAKGFIFLEVGDPGALVLVLRGLRHVKRKRPIQVKEEDVMKIAKPVVEVPTISKGQVIEVIGGPFKGMKGRVVEVYEARKEADVTLLETDYRMVVTISLDLLKPAT
ncbi:MAG: KOW motif-containing protein [Acidilobaceae archaeon]|nr:KOW motif-containing protein [Acidilobaceae archaeon]MCX8165084.1 KOW motif-containing protein [Acidilobaceae archaeon]MDW7974399.1 KOW motif-containing protein [Sulfolobales archaeon]